MKKLLTLIALLCCMQAFGQSPLHKALAKLAKDKNIEAITLTKADIRDAFANAVEGEVAEFSTPGGLFYFSINPYSRDEPIFVSLVEYIDVWSIYLIKKDPTEKQKKKLFKDLRNKAKDYITLATVNDEEEYLNIMYRKENEIIRSIFIATTADEGTGLMQIDCNFPDDLFSNLMQDIFGILGMLGILMPEMLNIPDGMTTTIELMEVE